MLHTGPSFDLGIKVGVGWKGDLPRGNSVDRIVPGLSSRFGGIQPEALRRAIG